MNNDDKFTFFAWTAGQNGVGKVFTVSETPQVGDAVYTSPNVESEDVISAVVDNTITVLDKTYNRANDKDETVDLFHHIITEKEMYELTRANYMDSAHCETFIEEAEMMYLKGVLGDELFLDLTMTPLSGKYTLLLDGGRYECDGHVRYFKGLKKALAYFAYARAVKSGSNVSTRSGNKTKRNEYSEDTQFQDVNMQYREAFEVADQYLADCVTYIKTDTVTFSRFKTGRQHSPHSIQVRIIGK